MVILRSCVVILDKHTCLSSERAHKIKDGQTRVDLYIGPTDVAELGLSYILNQSGQLWILDFIVILAVFGSKKYINIDSIPFKKRMSILRMQKQETLVDCKKYY